MNAAPATTTTPPPPQAELTSDLPPELLGLSLQLSRAGMMALTRLQLAIQSGDRNQAMEAMDRLHTLDAEMETLVASLPPPGDEDREWNALNKHVSDQKLAIAFEKLALVSEISGPGMISPATPATRFPPCEHDENPPITDWPNLPQIMPHEWKPRIPAALALALALLLTAALAAVAVLITTM